MGDAIEADAGPRRETASTIGRPAAGSGQGLAPSARDRPPLSAVTVRLVDTSAAIMGEAAGSPAFLHAVMSQVCLPYREPQGREYHRATGRASLVITAGHLLD